MAQQKTKVKPPKKRQKPTLPPQEIESSQNLHKEDTGNLAQMKFAVDQEFRKEFKLYATEHDMTLKELFEKSYEYYKAAHP